MSAILMVKEAPESGIITTDLACLIVIKTFSVGDDHRQVESCATGKTCEQSGTFMKTLKAEHQGRFTEI